MNLRFVLNMYFRFLVLLCFLPGFSPEVKSQDFMFRIELKDKGKPPYSIDNPSAYLSQKSIERRQKQGIAIDSTDLPLDPAYMEQIRTTGATIKAVSKWLGTVVVHLSDSSRVTMLKNLNFVDSVHYVWKGTFPHIDVIKTSVNPDSVFKNTDAPEKEMNAYGEGYSQINMLNGVLLHELGFKGKGMMIAVMDGGFQNVDLIPLFSPERIKEVRSFSHRAENPLRNGTSHGTSVLSCMLANESGVMIGTAPEADYYLLSTEVSGEEYPVEEDYWVAAAEYADSIGVDIFNTSLGYSTFDDSTLNHSHEQLDGKTIPISKAASMAGNKGILLFNSAGHEGNKAWVKISPPADAMEVVTVGAVNENKEIAAFSSYGPTEDKRVKPDMVALGQRAAIVNETGAVVRGNGTSFATPVLAGMGACLWQALPHKTSKEIIALMQSVSDRYTQPDDQYGFGIPDIYQAYTGATTGIDKLQRESHFLFFDSRENRLYINCIQENCKNIDLRIFNGIGGIVAQYTDLISPVDLSSLPPGIYIAHLYWGKKLVVGKFVKL